MYPNINAGLGKLMAEVLINNEANIGTTGRFFLVGGASITNINEIKAMYQSYPDGTPVVYTTLTLALAQCVANRGDVIFVLPNHTETIIGAAGVNVNVAGVSILGLGQGSIRPTYTSTTAVGASFDVNAANVTIKNLLFVCGIDNQTAMNNVSTADVTFDSCEWRISDGTVGAALGILTAATATRLKVVNSRFIGPAINAGTTCAGCIQHEAGTDYVIENNFFTGKMTQAIKNVATVLRGKINNNIFVIGTGTSAITMAAASTPMITNNRMNVASGTTPVTAAAGFVAGNTYSAAAGVTAGTASTF